MHELSVATELYQGVRDEIDELGGGWLRAVTIVVGELAALEPDLLQYAWEAVVAGGSDAGAQLEIEWRPVTQRCPTCGEIEEPVAGSWLRLCPTCNTALSLEGGRELDVAAFEYDEVPRFENTNPRSPHLLECNV